MYVDYIVVGQGLAGSAVAIQLIKRNKKIVVIDQPLRNNSSRIAAGLFNPITGKNLVKTWMADEVFPYLHSFYQQTEKDTAEKFFYPLPLYRPFGTIEEQNEWMAKSADPIYHNYLDKILTYPSVQGLKDPYGGLWLKQCGFLDTAKYIQAVSILIQEDNTLLQDEFKDELLLINENSVEYGPYKANKIIFCNGVHQNKWFSALPIRASKGETLNIQSDYEAKWIINRGIYLVPSHSPGIWRLGATYNFHDKTPQITLEGRQALETKVKEVINFKYEVIKHEWGMRPTIHDRKPVLGAHPHHKPLIIFNGLGTKGVSLAPYFSQVLIHWLENGVALNKAVDIERYKSVYSGSPS